LNQETIPALGLRDGDRERPSSWVRSSTAGREPARPGAFHPGLGVVDEPGLEVWFGNIERQAIRSGAFCSVKDPNVKIPALTGNWNDRGHPSSEPRPPTRSSVRGEPSKDFELTPLK